MTQTKFFGLAGGMDIVTPSIVVAPGRVSFCRNHEAAPNGYRRVDGWEVFDGRPSPSDAEFQVISFENGTFMPTPGLVITGVSSGQTAKVLYSPSVYSGDPSLGTAAGAFPVKENTGLLNGEDVRFGATPVATLTSAPGESGPLTPEEESAWTLAARDDLRSVITAVPGSGPIRGVHTFRGDVYAFRDNAGATAGVMHKATASGWQPVSLDRVLAFDAGTAAMSVGETITGGASGATALIKKVVLEDGDWTTDDGAGRLVLGPVTGTFQNNETITSTGAGSATADGVIAPITLPPGGRYHFDNHEFLATATSLNMYGANGVGPAFEYDGTVLTPINAPGESGFPIRVAAHSDHLFLAFPNGSLIHSALFKPLNFEIILGAFAGGIGEPITDMVPTSTGELAIFGRNKVAVLYGTNAETWRLTTLTNESGAVPWTTQLIGSPTYLDNMGVRSLDSTQSWGNFTLGTKTQSIQPYMMLKMKSGAGVVGSMRVRQKDQYRLFWNDGSGVSIYFGRKQPESMLFQLDFTPTCMCSGEDSQGREILFVGSDSGYVYQMDKGTSANGDTIQAYIRMPFNHVGSPTQDKRWHKALLEVNAPAQTKISVVYSCSYGDIELPQASEQNFDISGGGGFWNESSWNTFIWGATIEGTADVDIDGIGQNLSLTVISDEKFPNPYTVHGVTLHYNYRRLVR